jgi:hypothetical protein
MSALLDAFAAIKANIRDPSDQLGPGVDDSVATMQT